MTKKKYQICTRTIMDTTDPIIKFNEIEDLVKTFDPMYPGLNTNWRENLDSTIVDVEGYQLSLSKLRELFESNSISSNPNDPILRRWGL